MAVRTQSFVRPDQAQQAQQRCPLLFSSAAAETGPRAGEPPPPSGHGLSGRLRQGRHPHALVLGMSSRSTSPRSSSSAINGTMFALFMPSRRHSSAARMPGLSSISASMPIGHRAQRRVGQLDREIIERKGRGALRRLYPICASSASRVACAAPGANLWLRPCVHPIASTAALVKRKRLCDIANICYAT